MGKMILLKGIVKDYAFMRMIMLVILKQGGKDMGDKEILKEKAYSRHPDDIHLSVVLVHLPGRYYDKFATYLKNAEDDNGFYHGHYFSDLAIATNDFKHRGVEGL